MKIIFSGPSNFGTANYNRVETKRQTTFFVVAQSFTLYSAIHQTTVHSKVSWWLLYSAKLWVTTKNAVCLSCLNPVITRLYINFSPLKLISIGFTSPFVPYSIFYSPSFGYTQQAKQHLFINRYSRINPQYVTIIMFVLRVHVSRCWRFHTNSFPNYEKLRNLNLNNADSFLADRLVDAKMTCRLVIKLYLVWHGLASRETCNV